MLNSLRKTGSAGLFICAFLSVIILFGCKENQDNQLVAFRSLNETMESSTRSIYNSTENILKSLEDRTMDSATARRARVWYANALHIEELTKGMNVYIGSLKNELKMKTVYETDKGKDAFREDDMNAVYSLFEAEGKGKELEEKIYAYADSLLAVDDAIDSAFRKILFTVKYVDSSGKPEPGVIRSSFKEIPTITALALLSKFQNDIKTAENRAVQFCHNKTSGPSVIYFQSAIIGQNSTIVQAGDKIEITAGVGALSKDGEPEITINGKIVQLNEYGAAVYKAKTNNKPGIYTIPVKIEFTDIHTGRREEISKDVKYTVR